MFKDINFDSDTSGHIVFSRERKTESICFSEVYIPLQPEGVDCV